LVQHFESQKQAGQTFEIKKIHHSEESAALMPIIQILTGKV
jgi:hypothetical protein